MRIRDLLKKSRTLLTDAAEAIEREAEAAFGVPFGLDPDHSVLWMLHGIDQADHCHDPIGFAKLAERAHDVASQLRAALDRQNIAAIDVNSWFELASYLETYIEEPTASKLAGARLRAEILLRGLERLASVLEDPTDRSENLLTLTETASRLQVSRKIVEQLVKSGELSAIEIGGGGARKRLRITPAAIELWQQKSTHQPGRTSKRRQPAGKPARQWIK